MFIGLTPGHARTCFEHQHEMEWIEVNDAIGPQFLAQSNQREIPKQSVFRPNVYFGHKGNIIGQKTEIFSEKFVSFLTNNYCTTYKKLFSKIVFFRILVLLCFHGQCCCLSNQNKSLVRKPIFSGI